MDWPGWDMPRPVVINAGRPQRNRPRLASEHLAQPHYFTGPDGQLLVPAGGSGGMHRSSSTSGYRHAPQLTIINDNKVEVDEFERERRPRSAHGHRRHSYREHSYSDHSRSRSRSRSRVRVRSRTSSREREHREHTEREHRYETEVRLKKLEELEKREEDEKRRKRIEEEVALKKLKEEAERAERKKKEEEFKKQAVAEYNAKQAEEKEKKRKEKEAADKEYEERMRKTLSLNGYSDAEIDKILHKADKKEHDHEAGHGHEMHQPKHKESKVLALSRPTFIKVHRKYMDPDTLDAYELPWEWDNLDNNYIIIKQWIPESQQEILFEHTRTLRERKLLTVTTTELKKERDQLLLVRRRSPRKKSPARNWFLT